MQKPLALVNTKRRKRKEESTWSLKSLLFHVCDDMILGWLGCMLLIGEFRNQRLCRQNVYQMSGKRANRRTDRRTGAIMKRGEDLIERQTYCRAKRKRDAISPEIIPIKLQYDGSNEDLRWRVTICINEVTSIMFFFLKADGQELWVNIVLYN